MTKKVVAIVPGAGIGKRFGPGTNKPFEILAGKPLLVWVLEALESVEEVSEIIPVIKDENMGGLPNWSKSTGSPRSGVLPRAGRSVRTRFITD